MNEKGRPYHQKREGQVQERKLKSKNGKLCKKFFFSITYHHVGLFSMSPADTNNHKKIVMTLQEMPRESIQGGEVWSLELGGSYAVGRVMRKSEWIKKRVFEDWEIFREDEGIYQRIEESEREVVL